MSRVQCPGCGIAVVLDPTGMCPEGHIVGSAGARVARGMGSDGPDPDEPEPWMASVVLDDAGSRPVAHQRTIRPVQVAGAGAEDVERATDQDADHESMLRELHDLGDIHGASSTSAAPPPAGDQTSSNPPPGPGAPDPAVDAVAPSAPAGSEARPETPAANPPQEPIAEGFAELAALEAAFHLMKGDEEASLHGAEAPAPAAPTSPTATGPTPGNELADFQDLFVSQAAHASDQSPSTPPGGAPAAPHDATDAAAPPSARPAPAADPNELHVETRAAPDSPPPAAPAPDEPEPAPDATPPVTLDITNFTARGGRVGASRGGLRKRFGR